MYVAPTPYALADGTAHQRTLILPEAEKPGAGFVEVGTLTRREVDRVVTAYQFDLRNNELRTTTTTTTTTAPNPNAGREHVFVAYRLAGDPTEPVTLRSRERILRDLQSDAEGEDE